MSSGCSVEPIQSWTAEITCSVILSSGCWRWAATRLDQAVFAKFSKLIFRFRNAVTKGDKNITGIQFHCLFGIIAVGK